jgi:hypothetical protein
LIVAAPRDRAIRRRAILTQLEQSPGLWQDNAKAFCQQQPALAALADDLIAPLLTLRKREKQLSRQRKATRRVVVQATQKNNTVRNGIAWAVVVAVAILARIGSREGENRGRPQPLGSSVNQ